MEKITDNKSTVEEIRMRFDQDVARFSNLDTGQQTTLDAPLNMELITDAISRLYQHLDAVLDVGCGAGNYTLKLLQKVNARSCTLNDLSAPMLQAADRRLRNQLLEQGRDGSSEIVLVQGDIRNAALPSGRYDAIMAAAVLHHLRDDCDWETTFAKLYDLLRPGGSLWISDLVHQESPAIQSLIYTEKYGDYLTGLKDTIYRDHVFAYIDKEDTPRPLMYQIRLMENVGFKQVEILHKNLCFASFGAIK